MNLQFNSLFLLDLEWKAILKPYVFIGFSLYRIRSNKIRYSEIRYSEFYGIRYSDHAFQKAYVFIGFFHCFWRK